MKKYKQYFDIRWVLIASLLVTLASCSLDINPKDDDDFTGEQFTLSFYDRNLKIYNNILRNIDFKSDKVILVLFGAAHTNIMRQFFENHPYFEIVELETVFK